MVWRQGARASAVNVGCLLAAAIVVLAGCTPSNGQTKETPDPAPPSSSAPSPSPTPSPTPSPDPEDVAVEGAKAGYVAYWKALDELSGQGGAEKPTAAMRKTMTGRELKLQTRSARGMKKQGISTVGEAAVEDMSVTLVNVDHEPPLVKLRTCVDLSEYTSYRNGKPMRGTPEAFEEAVELHLVDRRWKVADLTNERVDGCN